MRLSDMYKTSTEVTFMPESDAEETVSVVKLNEPEQATLARKAGAARARAIAELRDPESDLSLELRMVLVGMTEDELISQIIDEDLEQKLLSVHEELAASDEWSTDDYLHGLEEAWNGSADEPGLKVTGADTEEGQRVLNELSRFHTKVGELIAAERADLRAGFEGLDMEFLLDKAYAACVKRKADQVFMDEYVRRRTYMSTRVGSAPEDRRKYYFDSIEDYDDCDEMMIKQRLMKAYAEMAVEGVEGKESPGHPGSSPSSEAPATEPVSARSARPAVKRSKTSRASG